MQKGRLAENSNTIEQPQSIAATVASIPELVCGLRIGFCKCASVYREKCVRGGLCTWVQIAAARVSFKKASLGYVLLVGTWVHFNTPKRFRCLFANKGFRMPQK